MGASLINGHSCVLRRGVRAQGEVLQLCLNKALYFRLCILMSYVCFSLHVSLCWNAAEGVWQCSGPRPTLLLHNRCAISDDQRPMMRPQDKLWSLIDGKTIASKGHSVANQFIEPLDLPTKHIYAFYWMCLVPQCSVKFTGKWGLITIY